MQTAAAAAMAAKAANRPTNFLKMTAPGSLTRSAARGRGGEQQADQDADAERGAGGGQRPFLDAFGDVLLSLVDLLAGGVRIGAALGAKLLDALGHGALDALGGVAKERCASLD